MDPNIKKVVGGTTAIVLSYLLYANHRNMEIISDLRAQLAFTSARVDFHHGRPTDIEKAAVKNER